LYKRLREFHWQEPIHEEVRLEPVVYDSDIEITHLPQGEHTGRDLETVEKILEQGGELSPRLRDFYLRELYFAGDKHNLEKARPYLEGLVEEAEPDSDAFQRAEALLCREARLTGDEVRLLKYALKGVASAGSSELCLELGDYFAAKEDDQEAMLWYYNAAWETESYLDILASRGKPLKRLAECCRRMGDEAKAEEYLKQLEE
jgi:hypothetical protein